MHVPATLQSMRARWTATAKFHYSVALDDGTTGTIKAAPIPARYSVSQTSTVRYTY